MSLDGKISDLQNPAEIEIDSESDLAKYLNMPYQRFEGIEPLENLDQAKEALGIMLDNAKLEDPNIPVKKVLFD